ncbi:hypothetical protein IJ425_06415 [bacterium]|nr:hypothetical protein [bacterium]
MSSGCKILNAKDNAARCVISTKISTKLSGINAIQKNSQHITSLLNLAIRIRGLSLQSMNGSTSNEVQVNPLLLD